MQPRMKDLSHGWVRWPTLRLAQLPQILKLNGDFVKYGVEICVYNDHDDPPILLHETRLT
jgi:hypothetical protein